MNTRREMQRRTLDALLLILAIITISAAVYFAAIDKPLMTSVVSFSGLLPAGAVVYGLPKYEPPPIGDTLIKRQHHTGFAILWIGITGFIGG